MKTKLPENLDVTLIPKALILLEVPRSQRLWVAEIIGCSVSPYNTCTDPVTKQWAFSVDVDLNHFQKRRWHATTKLDLDGRLWLWKAAIDNLETGWRPLESDHET